MLIIKPGNIKLPLRFELQLELRLELRLDALQDEQQIQGGLGQVNVKRIDVKLTRTDGTTQTGTLGTKKGDTFELDGTRGSGTLSGQPDRVEVWVITNAGQTYKVVDKIVPYRTRG